MKKIIALFLVLSLLSFPQLGVAVVSAEGREAGLPAQPAAALTDTADAGEAVPELEAGAAVPAGYSGPEASDPSLEPAAVRGAEDAADEISYTIEDGVLRVTGSGAMPDYEYGKAPWYESRDTIRELVVGDGFTSVGTFAFYGLYGLEKAVIPASVTVLKRCAFAECSSLREVSELTNVTEIDYGGFALCYSLAELSMPSVAVLEDYVFQGTQISSFQIPLAMHTFNASAFFGTNLREISVAPNHAEYKTQDGVLFTADGKTLVLYPACREGTSYTVPAGTEVIGGVAFARNAKLQSVDLGGVNFLRESAFQECALLEQIELPDSVDTAYSFTFYGCSALQSVSFGSGLETTSYCMFEKCRSLQEIEFGTGLRTVGALCFAYCGLTTLELPAQIEEVQNGAFADCRRLTQVHLHGLHVIAFQTFMNDTALSELILEEGTRSINRASFNNCPALKSVTIPASCTYVDSLAFPKTTELHCLGENMYPYGYNGYRALDLLQITGVQEYDNAYAVLAEVNARRAENGLEPLVMEQELLSAAMCRAGECALLFAHTRPDSGICFTACSKMIGENIAAGQGTPEAVMESWMNSDGHRENILNANYHSIGIGCFQIGGVRFWAQCFGSVTADANCAQPANATVSQLISVCPEPFEDAPSGTGVVFSFGSDPYEFKLSLTAEQSVLNMGDGTKISAGVKNPGFPGYRCPIDPESLCWASSDTVVAAVDAGAVSTTGAGMIEITAAGPRGFLSGTAVLDIQSPACSGGHDWDDGVLTAPSCTEPGLFRQRCKVCNMKKDQEFPALGHAWQLTEILTEGESLHESTGLYTCERCQGTKEAPLCAAEVFTDMPEEDHWAHNAIDWAYFNGYTSGTSATTFSPDATLTRGQVVTFLYAFRGKPETEAENPFQDVSETDYYYKPVLWAVANGITRGMDETHFAPADSCVRAQIVTFLWAAAGHPEPEGTENPFEDVSETDYFYKPVIWAVENGITRGMDETHFAPAQACTRAQMVTFLKAAAAVLSDR